MKKTTNKKATIATIAIIATLTTGTISFATQHFDGLRELYGEQPNLISQNKTTINQFSVVSGVKMTVTESIISDKGAIIVATFEKEDGKPFEKDAVISTIEITNRKDLSYMINQTLSEDRTKIIASLEIDSSKSLENQMLTVVADKIINTATNETLAAGSWNISFTAKNQKLVKEQIIDQLVEKDHEKMTLTKINVSSLGVAVEGIRLDGETDTLPSYMPSVEITTADGKVVQLTFDSASETETGFRIAYVNKTDAAIKEFLKASDIKKVSIDGQTITLN